MPYVFLLPHSSYARIRYMGYPSEADREVFDWGADWASQVVRRSNRGGGSDAVHVMAAASAGATHDDVLSATVEAYRAAAQQAGSGGTLGVLMGHGGGVTHPCTMATPVAQSCPPWWSTGQRRSLGSGHYGVQLAPSGHLNVTELHLEVLREMHRSRCAIPRDLSVIDSIGNAIRGVQHVDFYSCEIGTTSDGGFLANLSNYWHTSVAALRGTVVLIRAVRPQLGPVDLAVRRDGRDGARYRRSRPPEALWARANNAVYEAPVRGFGQRPLTCRDFGDGR